MKRLFLVFPVVAMLSGCALLPKQVEFFQDKVEQFPEARAREQETQRKAAALAARRAEDTLLAAVSNQAPAAVLVPARDVAALTEAVTTSLGPPSSPWTGSATNLATKLDSATAALNSRVDAFKRDNNANAGKKIEGTGFFQIGFFSLWALVLGGLALVWGAFKVWGMFNPVVGMGTNIVGRVSTTVLKKGVSELAEGGEWFKEYLAESSLAEDVKKVVRDLFSRAHVEAQSRDTQTLVTRLTEK
jgi:hypothetical protein